MSNALYPECPECNQTRDIRKAEVTQKPDSTDYEVTKYNLSCGHTVENPEAIMEEGVVEMFRLQHPDLISVV